MAGPAYSSHHISDKARQFTESVIREMTREAMKYGTVNLSQGFPDFAVPDDIKQIAMQAIADDINQYEITWGAKDFREAIASKTKWYLGLDIDPETEVTVTCGATEGMIAAMIAAVDPGEEVIVFDPFYEKGWMRLNLSNSFARFATGNFATPSGKCELYSASLLVKGHSPVPEFVAPRESRQSAPDLGHNYPLAS